MMSNVEKRIEERKELHEVSPGDRDPIATVDTTRQDEALRVLSQYTGDKDWTSEEEGRLRHKIDRKLMPLLCITYGLQVRN